MEDSALLTIIPPGSSTLVSSGCGREALVWVLVLGAALVVFFPKYLKYRRTKHLSRGRAWRKEPKIHSILSVIVNFPKHTPPWVQNVCCVGSLLQVLAGCLTAAAVSLCQLHSSPSNLSIASIAAHCSEGSSLSPPHLRHTTCVPGGVWQQRLLIVAPCRSLHEHRCICVQQPIS